jgi:hypothetical protein
VSRVCYLIFGNKSAGKDTLGNFLTGALVSKGHSVQRYAFAKPIKEAATHLLGMPWSVAEGSEEVRRSWEKYGRDARVWLQWLGTELGRNQIHQDVWVHRAIDRVNNSTDNFVITDGRFKNELYLFKNDCECKLVPIRIRRAAMSYSDSHRSETEQLEIEDLEFQFVVENDGTLRDLEAKAQYIVETTV